MPKTTLTLPLFAITCCLQGAEITEAPATRVNSLAPAFSAVGRVQIIAAEARLRIPIQGGGASDGDILVLYDTDTRHFLWRAELTHSPGNFDGLMLLSGLKLTPSLAVFSSSESTTWWRAEGTKLVVEVFTETARTLDEAFGKALADLNAGLGYSTMGSHPDRRTIESADRALEEDFIRDRSSSVPHAYGDGPPAIVDMRRANNEYTITMRAQWMGETTITDDFQMKTRLHRVPGK